MDNLDNINFFSHTFGGYKSKIKISRSSFLCGFSFWPPSYHALTWPFICMNAPCDISSSHFRTLFLLKQGPTLMTSFNFNYLFVCPIPKYSLIGDYGFKKWILAREKQYSPQQWLKCLFYSIFFTVLSCGLFLLLPFMTISLSLGSCLLSLKIFYFYIKGYLEIRKYERWAQ